MSASAYITALSRGVANPPIGGGGGGSLATTLPWHEDFTEADLNALDTKYAGTGSAILPSGGFIFVTGGALEIKGDPSSPGFPQAVVLNTPPLTASYRELWMRIQVEMVGGAYDSNSCAIQSFITSSVSGLEADIDGFGGGSGSWEMYLWPDATQPDSGIDHRMAAGLHTFIMCASEDSATVWRGELWIDASPGDAPQISDTSSKVAGTGFDNISLTLRGPEDAARTMRFLDISVIDGDRASDPFGIL